MNERKGRRDILLAKMPGDPVKDSTLSVFHSPVMVSIVSGNCRAMGTDGED